MALSLFDRSVVKKITGNRYFKIPYTDVENDEIDSHIYIYCSQ